MTPYKIPESIPYGAIGQFWDKNLFFGIWFPYIARQLDWKMNFVLPQEQPNDYVFCILMFMKYVTVMV